MERSLSVYCPYCGTHQRVHVDDSETWVKVECTRCDGVFGIANPRAKEGNILGFRGRQK